MADPIDQTRSIVRSAQRIMAVGLLSLVLGSVLTMALTLNVLGPALRNFGVDQSGSILLSGLIARAGILVALPGLAWGAGFVVDERPSAVGFGAAAFIEASLLLISYMSKGATGILSDPGYLLSQWGFGFLAGLLAMFAFRNSQRRADKGAGRRGPAPQAAATPEPAREPDPEPAPAPEPDPVAEPEPDSEPKPEPDAE